MKKTVFIVMAVFTALCMSLFSSCNNQELDGAKVDNSLSVTILEKFGKVHNEGLDFIKGSKEKTSGTYSQIHLDYVFREYVSLLHGSDNTERILENTKPFTEQLLTGNIPTLTQVRSGEFEYLLDQANPLALEALRECLIKITNHLSMADEDNILDNPVLLSDLHDIISKIYIDYANTINDPSDLASIELTLGVLYGSVEYWSNSKNIEYWSNIIISSEDDNNAQTRGDSKPQPQQPSNPQPQQQQKQKLTTAEYISVVGGADAIGALLGPEMAVIASGAAALYYDVE